MNIPSRIRDRAIQGKNLDGGFALLRRCYDGSLVGQCATLQEAYPDIEVQSNVRGVNRLSMHLLSTGEVRQNRAHIGGVSLKAALKQVLKQAPSVMDRMDVSIDALRIERDRRNNQGNFYLEGVLSEESLERLEAESGNITGALETFAPEAQYSWTELPSHITLAIIPGNTAPDDKDRILASAQSHIQTSFNIGLTVVQCTVPNLGRPAA